jgi:glutamate-1-semialdehyde 2,1-aminomutase
VGADVKGAAGTIPADKEFLVELRRITREIGAFLIFDEVITGFRLAPGGAQEFYGVIPDVSTFGKVAGGGLPFGAVGGPAEAMRLTEYAVNPGLTFPYFCGQGVNPISWRSR